MRNRIGRKLIFIGMIGFIIWLLLDIIFVMVPYTKEGIENIIRYRWYISLSEMVFKSRLFGIAGACIKRLYLIYFAVFLLKSENKSNLLIKINCLFFIGFYIEHFPGIRLTFVFKIVNALLCIMIIVGIILLETEWFTKGHRIENYGKAILTVSSWIMLILSGSYVRRIASSITTDFSERGMRETSNIIGVDNIDIIWVIKFNIFMLLMCVSLLVVGVKILKRLKEDDTENMLLKIVIIGILIIYTGVYRGTRSYPVGIIRYIWQLHWFLGSFLIVGGILNHIGIRLRNRKETVDLQEK